MSPSGVVLVIAGAWILCQVLGGNALGRLNITGQTQAQPTAPGAAGGHSGLDGGGNAGSGTGGGGGGSF